ncbi:hypothetical protein H5410_009904 [Solanum commersonii]|uniref:DUF4283 domain-containing protein n=1 Tax=Solanum commersonii TaxID=4109 RepID=A0A9J6AJ89_SOLCO|nr:hypothetical protein H5410_009904 [Solanum commersonii]
MAWISFPNLLPTYFVKEYLFSLAAAVGKPLNLDLATIKTFKVLVHLNSDLSKVIRMNIKNEETGVERTETVHIRYDYLPKYCFQCKLQGHDEVECRVLNPELRPEKENNELPEKENEEEMADPKGKAIQKNHKQNNRNKYPLKILSSGKIVGNLQKWNAIKSKAQNNEGKSMGMKPAHPSNRENHGTCQCFNHPIHGRDDGHASLVAMKYCCSASETINLLCQFSATSY